MNLKNKMLSLITRAGCGGGRGMGQDAEFTQYITFIKLKNNPIITKIMWQKLFLKTPREFRTVAT